MCSLIKVENLNIHFSKQDNHAVQNLSFSLEKGKVIGSGSGKSLTALSLMGLLPNSKELITSGKALFTKNDNEILDLYALKERHKRSIRGKDICMIFQEPMSSLNPALKCGFQACEQLRYHFSYSRKKAKKAILEMFEKVLLPDPQRTFQSYPHQLSGGQRQRVMIAMAMSVKPMLLIADEPTTALDVTVQKEILELIRNLQRENNTSIIFISHDLAVVKSIADDILVMKKGIIEEYNTVENIFSSPKADYTKALLLCRPKIGNNPTRLESIENILHPEKETSIISKNTTINYNEEAILKVEKLNTWFPLQKKNTKTNSRWLKANDDISFSLYRGETLGIVGESGSGKSTLIRSILQLIQSNSGKVIYKNVDLCSLKAWKMRKLRKDLQVVFQDPYSSLNPQMRISAALLEPMKSHRIFNTRKERQEYIEFILGKTGMNSDCLQKYPHQFSGGQRQRLVIARALVLKPKIVFCDESVAALDVSIQAQVLNLLNDLKDELGLTYVFISHDLNVISYMSDRILVMQKGKIIEQGLKNEIINNAKEDYTRKLIEAIP